jgi:hypothetical protein
MLNVQFSDSTETTIISYFSEPQSATTFPNQGQIEASDARWATYYNSLQSIIATGLPQPA